MQTTGDIVGEVNQPFVHGPDKMSAANNLVAQNPEVGYVYIYIYIYIYIYGHLKYNILQLLPGKSVDVTTNEIVKPLYQFQKTESFSGTPEVRDALKLFGYKSFRMKQEECIMRILSGIYYSYVHHFMLARSLLKVVSVYIH